MQFISLPDQPGSDSRSSLYELFVNAGVTLPGFIAIGIYVYETSGGGATSRIGGPDVAAGRGVPIAAGGSDSVKLDVMPLGGSAVELYDLRRTFVWLASGDTIGVTAMFL